ncbi:conserved hypothetical protein [Talaromyces stipitatus ATCC 10500]|uniref:ATP-grasp domain-containing protein n=1 Tax=Talaromyces stipitatus (strain ATCC 10500 / CBS 375.48 / QM 6759 / NRRL 1006) TaxID=441959 RepID=B8MVK6_TALSN|nr:uncharacterized protein TSTA_080410 [Talaromyces stipitatus ATCC 10500]EED11430.1 conserved hypothetical protein [Talaromyces stipitatus ATCC 10500]
MSFLDHQTIFFRITYPDEQEYFAVVNWRQAPPLAPLGPQVLFRCIDVAVTMVELAPSSHLEPWAPQSRCPCAIYCVDTRSGHSQKIDLSSNNNSLPWHFLFKIPGGPFGPMVQYFVKLVLSTTSGYLSRCDFLERRMLDCHWASQVMGFYKPRQYVSALSLEGEGAGLLANVSSSIGGILLRQGNNAMPVTTCLEELDRELFLRITAPFLSKESIPRKVIALVDGRRNLNLSPAAEGIFRAARALGIGIVVVDQTGHWLQSKDHGYLRDDFLAIDMKIDDNLPGRIVHAIRQYGISVDGITTFSDKYLLPTARAAAALGLPTSPDSAIFRCTNKYETRNLDSSKASQVYRISSQEGLEELIASSESTLAFPMIVKPCSGTSSAGVYKVNNVNELRLVVNQMISSANLTSNYGLDFLLEPYINGPEVDVNLVLVDGEIIFSEINDDFPSPGDSSTAQLTDTFIDTTNLFPSALPEDEKALLRSHAYDVVSSLGFRNGVFHLEARVHNSSMGYARGHKGGLAVDLQLKHRSANISSQTGNATNTIPSVFLIEVNARMPGYQGTTAIERAYGIDYYATYLLAAVADYSRMRDLSIPFHSDLKHWYAVVRLHSDRGGIWISDDACQELLDRRPDLQENVSYCRCCFQRGQEVYQSTANDVPFIAYFIVYSRRSRQHLLSVVDVIKKNFRYELISKDEVGSSVGK